MTDRQVWFDAGGGTEVGVPADADLVDSEGRFPWEPYGYQYFTWLPRRCRNGKVRWLCQIEDHGDGTYTKGRLK